MFIVTDGVSKICVELTLWFELLFMANCKFGKYSLFDYFYKIDSM